MPTKEKDIQQTLKSLATDQYYAIRQAVLGGVELRATAGIRWLWKHCLIDGTFGQVCHEGRYRKDQGCSTFG
jgi:hypothetical protein